MPAKDCRGSSGARRVASGLASLAGPFVGDNAHPSNLALVVIIRSALVHRVDHPVTVLVCGACWWCQHRSLALAETPVLAFGCDDATHVMRASSSDVGAGTIM